MNSVKFLQVLDLLKQTNTFRCSKFQIKIYWFVTRLLDVMNLRTSFHCSLQILMFSSIISKSSTNLLILFWMLWVGEGHFLPEIIFLFGQDVCKILESSKFFWRSGQTWQMVLTATYQQYLLFVWFEITTSVEFKLKPYRDLKLSNNLCKAKYMYVKIVVITSLTGKGVNLRANCSTNLRLDWDIGY